MSLIPKHRERSSCADKHDTLKWTCGFSVSAEGFRIQVEGIERAALIGVRTNDAGLLPVLRSFLPPHWQEVEVEEVDLLYSFLAGGEGQRRGVRNYNLSYVNCTMMGRELDPDQALSGFRLLMYVQTLYKLPILEKSVIVRASLAGDSRRIVALVAEQEPGETWKSNLQKTGLKPLTCPYLLLDKDGQLVEPFARIMGLPGPLTDIVFIASEPSSFTPGQGVLSLFSHSLGTSESVHGQERLGALAKAMQSTRIHNVSDPKELVGALAL